MACSKCGDYHQTSVCPPQRAPVINACAACFGSGFVWGKACTACGSLAERLGSLPGPLDEARIRQIVREEIAKSRKGEGEV